MARKIYLFGTPPAVYSAEAKKRPTEKQREQLLSSLDPSGKKLLDCVVNERFDAPDLPALEQEHLLATSWTLEVNDVWVCLAEFHPSVLHRYTERVARVLVRLALSYVKPSPDDLFREQLFRTQGVLAQITNTSERSLESHAKQLQREAFALERSTEPAMAMTRSAFSASACAFSCNAQGVESTNAKRLWAPAVSIDANVARAFAAVNASLRTDAAPWCLAVLRSELEGRTETPALPAALVFGSYPQEET